MYIRGVKTNIFKQIIHVFESPWPVQQTDKDPILSLQVKDN